MARNKHSLENKKGLKTDKKVYEVNISEGIVESSNTPETEEQINARKEREAQKTLRREKSTKKKNKPSIEASPKFYDILVMYHQLNYNDIISAVKTNGLNVSVIDNEHLWIINASEEEMNLAKKVLLSCHFTTKQGKQYRVRFAAYKHNAVIKTEPRIKKPRKNKPSVAHAAKVARKENNVKKFKLRSKHKSYRKGGNHKRGTAPMTNIEKKILKAANRAGKEIIKREEKKIAERLKTTKNSIKKSNKPNQKTLNFAA